MLSNFSNGELNRIAIPLSLQFITSSYSKHAEAPRLLSLQLIRRVHDTSLHIH